MSRCIPLVVDLDGTLARVDTLHESLVHALLRHPWQVLRALPALASSRAAFKAALASIPGPDRPAVPWNQDVLNSLARQRGGEIFVCTASSQVQAEKICAELGLFSAVYGSDAATNLKGERKAAFLREKFGSRGFQYYGNEAADLDVWKEAAKAFVVSDDAALVERARGVCPEVEQIPLKRRSRFSSTLRAARPHQWTKNLLLFVPLLTSHRFTEHALLLRSLAAFAAFCLLSSAVYVLNDLIDLQADRRHPSKSRRPFAAGDLSALAGLPLSLGLTAAALASAVLLGMPFFGVCCAYLGVTLLYSAIIKKIAVFDVYTLAGLYTLRLVAGGAVTGIVISVWLAAFSIFIFLSLALCKRYTELAEFQGDAGVKLNRRGYTAGDLGFVFTQGLIFMGCATLVLAVYLSSNAVTLLYKTPALLWLAVLVVSFWGGRLWLLAARREMHEDPVFFALKDRVSWCCLLVLFGVFFAAMKVG
jgi:4-hydroxybenzoate polyprenyltransferase